MDSRILEPVVRSAIAKEKSPDTQFVAVRVEVPPEGAFEVIVDGVAWEAHPVRSTLQARRVMARAGSDGHRVLLTSILENELGEEVMARLAQNQVHRVEPWQLVRSAFDAQSIDPRIRKEPWIAQTLLERTPAGGYPRVPAGTLDLDTVWDALWRHAGLPAGEPTSQELLDACVDGTLPRSWRVISAEFRDGLKRRMMDKVGEVGAAFGSLLDGDVGELAVAYGLIAESLFALDPNDHSRVKAEDRMDSKLGLARGVEKLGSLAVSWCEERIRSDRFKVLDPVFASTLDQAGSLLDKSLLGTSSVHPAGLETRVDLLAETLVDFLGSPGDEGLGRGVEDRVTAVTTHRLHLAKDRYQELLVTVSHTARLARWMQTQDVAPFSLQDAANHYRDEGAWVDRARYELARGQKSGAFQAALASLGRAVLERREASSMAFADRLATSNAGREGTGDVRPIEKVYREIVAPLAEQMPVLVVVLDGMSQAVFQQVARDLEARVQRTRMAPNSERSLRPVIAALPTVTEVSRASLLCGELTTGGTSSIETSGHASLASEFGWSQKADSGATLFHKGLLMHSGGGVSPEVRAALESPHKVVTVIINAIDDLLPKGDQIQLEWALSTLPELRALVHDDGCSGRALVLTADHGHVVELWEGESDAKHDGEKGERWRSTGRELDAKEILVEGPRVMLPQPGGPVVLPWSERLRYSSRHAGYHGGASPQEVVVPIGVFVPEAAALELKGWDAEIVVEPWWWTHAEAPPVRRVPEPDGELVKVGKKSTRTPKGQNVLFEEPNAATTPVEGEPIAARWVNELLSSQLYQSQKKTAARMRPDDEAIRQFLEELEALSGTATFDALRGRLGLQPRRFNGMVSLVTRLLNVDGFAVVEVSQSAKTVQINQELLARQFELKEIDL